MNAKIEYFKLQLTALLEYCDPRKTFNACSPLSDNINKLYLLFELRFSINIVDIYGSEYSQTSSVGINPS